MALSSRSSLVASSSSSSSRPVFGSRAVPRATPAWIAPQRQHLCLRGRRVPVSHVANVDEASFEAEVLKSEHPVLVDFWASWCGPCKLISPLMVWAEKEYQGSLKVVKIEVDANKSLVEKYKVYGLPTFIVFRDGQEVEDSKREGAISKNQLAAYLSQHGIAATVSK